MKIYGIFVFISLLHVNCGSQKVNNDIDDNIVEKDVNPSFFTSANPNATITKVPCTLSDGTETDCYKIVTNTTPTDHQMGPWCPDNISDDASAGGIWM